MSQPFLKNIEFNQVLPFANLVEYQQGRVVSLTLAQKDFLSMTLFAFSKDESISTHSSPGDAFVYILDGQADVTVGMKTQTVKMGEAIVMPSDTPHGLIATENFKMLLIVIFK
jgi:quercetin dioxygenase-like cupin family protein